MAKTGGYRSTVKESKTVDPETGLVIHETSIVREKIPPEPPFIKLYLNGEIVPEFKGISGTEVLLLLEMVKVMDYENVMAWSVEHKNRFCQGNEICLDRNGNVSPASFSNFMGRLCRKNLIRKLKRNQYQVNPEVFARGKWDNIYSTKKFFK